MKALKETHPCTKFMKISCNLIAVDVTGSRKVASNWVSLSSIFQVFCLLGLVGAQRENDKRKNRALATLLRTFTRLVRVVHVSQVLSDSKSDRETGA